MDDAIVIKLPAAVRGRVAPALEYEDDDPVKGARCDLNGDGADDYLVQSARSLCGNGGCPYAIVDGKSARELGYVMGSRLFIRAEKTHGFPVIDAYAHSSSDAGTLATYSYDGATYVLDSTQSFQGASLERLFTMLRRIPAWRPQP